jgi:DNA-binding CsgD family transcriptional regulator
VLLGREQERLAIHRVLAEARAGHSGVLALVGEPGIGKTALLEYAVKESGGMRVLHARGVESEAEVPFAGLAVLLRAALTCIDRIPAPQAQALSGALALGPARSVDRFAIGAATLSLLSAHADDGPLVLAVDDVHLLDRSSAEALLFALRRLIDDPIAVVLAVREGEPSMLDGADLRVLRVGGLNRVDAGELLAGLPPEAVDRVFRATGGNPLALLELAADATQLVEEPLDGPVPLSTSISAAFGRRLDRLPVPTRRILLLAATGDTRDLSVLMRAAARLGVDVADLTAAEEAGLVTLSGSGPDFTHPLIRSAVYAAASGRQRREAHAALAAALPDRDADRRAWHLAAATVGPDDAVSAALEQAGARATERSAYAVAARAYERAARLATTEDACGRLLCASADAAWLAGETGRTSTLLDAACTQTSDSRVLARIDQLRGHLLLRCGPVGDGYRLLAAAAERVAEPEPELAVVMLAESVQGAFYAGHTAAMVAAAARAVEVAEATDSPRAGFFAHMASAMALVADGEGEDGARHARRAVAILQESDELRDDPRLVTWATFGPMWLREADAGRDLIERASDQTRARGAAGNLPIILQHLARDQATTDRWAAAEANLDEAIRLAEETGQRSELAAALAGLAWLQARQGQEDACRRHADRAAALCDELGMGTYGVWAIQAVGDLELGLGRPTASVVHHEAQAEAMRERGIADVDLSPAPELVDAYLRLGRSDEAAEVASAYAAAAEAKGQPWALARAARCHGMLTEAGDWEEAFEEAIQLHDRTLDVFEEARTRLAFGARLRREQQRSRSRTELRAAFHAFERLGARPWADQARSELAATGETARRRDPSTLDDLTPQEFQIARMLAGGMTTREAAAAAFLSPKTIEYHLRNTYRKLGIRTREELATAMAPGEDPRGANRAAGGRTRGPT